MGMYKFLDKYSKEPRCLNTKGRYDSNYSRTSMAQTPMARLPWMSRTHS